MAQSMGRYCSIGDYIMGRQIGAGAYSTVWHGRHRVHGTEVAIKEILTSGMTAKLQESLKSEIFILKRIDHPNIIRLHDMLEEPGKIYIVLEYCKGGDLSKLIQQRNGKIPEATAKHFMQQLAKGLKVLRENNVIHRDLKPQNLLLFTNDDNSILKIADFGFARSLQPRGLAETMCGSPLYMAPEIMQLQKYDAKADLWSVGAILFQLVTGKTPFTGINQIHLLQNILKSSALQFPPEAKDLSPHCIDLCRKLLRRNPVERLTFEEFFNHPYLSNKQLTEPFSARDRQLHGIVHSFPLAERNTEESSQEDCLPFSLDDDSSIPDGSPSSPRRSTMSTMYLDSKSKPKDFFNFDHRTDSPQYNHAQSKTKLTGSGLGSHRNSEGNMKESHKNPDIGSLDYHRKVMDSLELIDQEYVIVSGPPLDLSSSGITSKTSNFPSANLPLVPGNMDTANSPMSMIGVTGRVDDTGSAGTPMSTPRTSRESMDMANISEKPSTDCMSRIKSLQHCASSITEIVFIKIDGGKHLEAFSVLLVVLAIWKQALDICHTSAASATEGNTSQDTTTLRKVSKFQHSANAQECHDISKNEGLKDICAQIEREFLHEVENAEGLAKVIDFGNMEMPDAMELIYQSALALGRRGAVDEYMGDIENAGIFYSKAARLLQFLLVEAPCLILNPPFSLTSSDRYRIKNYIDVLNNRQSITQSQRMALFRADEDPPRLS